MYDELWRVDRYDLTVWRVGHELTDSREEPPRRSLHSVKYEVVNCYSDRGDKEARAMHDILAHISGVPGISFWLYKFN